MDKTLIDYDEGVRLAHERLQVAKIRGEYNQDFYRGFCCCMRGFGESKVAVVLQERFEALDKREKEEQVDGDQSGGYIR